MSPKFGGQNTRYQWTKLDDGGTYELEHLALLIDVVRVQADDPCCFSHLYQRKSRAERRIKARVANENHYRSRRFR